VIFTRLAARATIDARELSRTERIMKTMHTIAGTLAGSMILTSLVFAAGNAVAQSAAAVKEDQVQTKADDSALARERARLRVDERTLGADTRSGRTAAESPDEDKVYKDRQAIKGEKSDLAGDKPGSLQERSDRNAVQREQANLKADTNTWAADARSGKMAAESTDAEKIYKDQQAIKGEKSAITSDRAKLNGDRKN
jgi:cell division protein FtsL